jgi:hypothetical protein
MLVLSSLFVIEQFAINLIEGIKNNIRNKQVTPFGAMHSTGKAEDSLFYRIEENRLIIGSTWAYITVLEDGRKPGTFAPPEVIEKWIDDKPVAFGDISKRSLAYLINRSLKEKGSLIYQQGGHSGILSDLINLDYVHKFLTIPLKQAVIDEVTGILFRQTVRA